MRAAPARAPRDARVHRDTGIAGGRRVVSRVPRPKGLPCARCRTTPRCARGARRATRASAAVMPTIREMGWELSRSRWAQSARLDAQRCGDRGAASPRAPASSSFTPRSQVVRASRARKTSLVNRNTRRAPPGPSAVSSSHRPQFGHGTLRAKVLHAMMKITLSTKRKRVLQHQPLQFAIVDTASRGATGTSSRSPPGTWPHRAVKARRPDTRRWPGR